MSRPLARDRRAVAALARAATVGAALAALGACAPAARTPSVNQPPLPALLVPATARVGESVFVDGSASSDPGGAVSDAVILFGDGSDPSPGLGGDHVYEAAGQYLVELYIVDDAGAPARARARITITE